MNPAETNTLEFSTSGVIPEDGMWVGRVWLPPDLAHRNIAGPHAVLLRGGDIFDLSEVYNATSELLNLPDPVKQLLARSWKKVADLSDVLDNSLFFKQNPNLPFLLAPNDIQAIKACGVTFIQSLLERVIEEKAKGAFWSPVPVNTGRA